VPAFCSALCPSAVRDLKHHRNLLLLGAMKQATYEERRGGGYRQLEKRRKLEEKAKLQQSSLAQYMVLKPPHLETSHPQQSYVFTEVFKTFRIFRAGAL